MKICSIAELQETEVSHNPKINKKVMISDSNIPSITNFSRAVFPPGEITPAHSHSDMTEVFYIESGRGSITVNERKFKISSGSCITVEPDESHEIRNTESTDMVILYFGVKTPPAT
jgi:mannose-6-phosphate isomerase-like protein (cupin superfamily)